MKLATYQDGSRDGQLVVVSRDLASAHYATGICSRLQAALDDWNFLSPQLQDLYDDLNAGRVRHGFTFEPERCMAPLPRAFGQAEAHAYPHHDDIRHAAETTGLVAAEPAPLWLRRLGGAELLGAQDAVVLPDADADFESGLAVITGDIPVGCAADRAVEGVRLVMLAVGIALRGPAADGFQARPATAFSPVAVTPDELGGAWVNGRLSGTLQTTWNGRKVGLCDAGVDMRFPFGEIVAAMSRGGRVRAGTIVGSGPVSNAGTPREAPAPGRGGRKGQPASPLEWPRGYSAIAEKRAMETLQDGTARTGWLQAHDTLRVEMKGRDGQSIFGAVAHEMLRGG
ncbi:fumarylacetoacetate hydrolase [Xylophilus sp. Kf1]|nr:fumarylacetoacetate hydrolase [Xylophilus sp. Kf1]